MPDFNDLKNNDIASYNNKNWHVDVLPSQIDYKLFRMSLWGAPGAPNEPQSHKTRHRKQWENI